MPVFTYGCESWSVGSPIVKAEHLQRSALAIISRVPTVSNFTSASLISRELGVPSIKEFALKARLRAFKKFPSLKTCIKSLVTCQPSKKTGAMRKTWVMETAKWVTKLKENAEYKIPRSAGRFGSALVEKAYLLNRYDETQDYVSLSKDLPSIAMGIHLLFRLRIQAFLFAPKMAAMGTLPTQFLRECPCCLASEPETPEHFLLKCSRFASEREILADFLSQPDVRWYNLLGGSRVSEGISLEPLKQQWLKGNMIPAQPGKTCLDSCVFVKIAGFLQKVWKVRKRILDKLCNPPP